MFLSKKYFILLRLVISVGLLALTSLVLSLFFATNASAACNIIGVGDTAKTDCDYDLVADDVDQCVDLSRWPYFTVVNSVGCPMCGDGQIQANTNIAVFNSSGSVEYRPYSEQCDMNGPNLGGMTCPALDAEYQGGTLRCTPQCTFNVSSCTITPDVVQTDVCPNIEGLQTVIPENMEFRNGGCNYVIPGGAAGTAAGSAGAGTAAGSAGAGSAGPGGFPGGTGSEVDIDNPLSANDITTLLREVLKAVVRILLPIIVIFYVITGLMFITARGNPQKLSTAKTALLYTTIGAGVVLGSWVLSQMISDTVKQITG